MAADAVAEAAQGEEEARHGQGVGVHDPLQGSRRRMKVPDQRRQGHVDDGVVHHDHEE